MTEIDTAQAAAEFDSTVMKSYVDWRPTGIGWEEARDVKAPVSGPFASPGRRVSLAVKPSRTHYGKWSAEATPGSGALMFASPGGGETRWWPSAAAAKAALEAVLFGAPEARAMAVARGPRPLQDTWDWEIGGWGGGE